MLLLFSGGAASSFKAAWAINANQIGLRHMKKNVAGQSVGAQMVSASDGSAFTGAVTIYVTLDAGVQAVGSVGAGACMHEGNGYHTYAPAQAETNGNLFAGTFTGSGAVPSSVQIWTSFPQTTDNPASLPNSGALTTLQADTDDIQTRLPAALVGGRMDSSIGAMAANVLTSAATAADFKSAVATALWTDTTAGDFTVALSVGKSVMNGVALGTGLTINAYAGNTVQTGDAFARLGAPAGASVSVDIAAIKTVADAVNAKTTNLPAAPAAVGDIPTAVQNADALLGRNVAGGSSAGRTVKEALYALRNKWTSVAGVYSVYGTDDTTLSWTSSLATDAAALPLIGSDPA